MKDPQQHREKLLSSLIVIVVLVLTGLMIGSIIWRSHARAQDAGAARLTSTLKTTLVHASTAETDFNPIDRSAVWHALQRRAERANVDLETMARDYVSAFRVKETPRLKWVLSIDASCDEPDGWPTNLNWEKNWRRKCEQAFDDAQKFLDGELKDPCPRATQWGSRILPSDVRRAAKAVAEGRWIPAQCATSNAFFREVR